MPVQLDTPTVMKAFAERLALGVPCSRDVLEESAGIGRGRADHRCMVLLKKHLTHLQHDTHLIIEASAEYNGLRYSLEIDNRLTVAVTEETVRLLVNIETTGLERRGLS